jgi:RHS repeat-associated protein
VDMTVTGSVLPYAADGRLVQAMLGSGQWVTMNYNTPGTATTYNLGSTQGSGDIVQLGYNFSSTNNNGNLTSQTTSRPGGAYWSQSFYYDNLNRLASANESGGWSRTYGYDRYGNRYVSATSGVETPQSPEPTSSSHFNTADNRLTMSGTGYDAAGNQTTYSPFTLEYDAESRNTIVKSSGTPYVTFSYDGEGRRVKKLASGVTTYYVHDALGQLAAEYSTQAPTSTGTSYMFTDMLGSVRTITDQGGNVLECYDYLPFGRMLGSGNNGRGSCYPTSPDVNYSSRTPQKFTGKERDAETGLDYFLARYYSGAQGRFLSPDEFKGGPDDALTGKDIIPPGPLPYADIANPQTLNKYTYVINNPLRFVDPDGHALLDWLFGKFINTTIAQMNAYDHKAPGLPKNIPFAILPGKQHKTAEVAAKEAIKSINPTSVKESKEFAGRVVVNANWTFGVAGPFRGTESSSNPGLVPFGTLNAARYHTHGSADPRFDNEHFSRRDKENARIENVPTYVGTPGGLIRRYTPSTNEDILVGHTPN